MKKIGFVLGLMVCSMQGFAYYANDYVVPKEGFVPRAEIVQALAHAYLNHLYFSDYYQQNMVELDDLVVKSKGDTWAVSHQDRLVMRLRKDNGAVLFIATFETHRVRADVEREGMVFSESLALAIAKIIWLDIYGKEVLEKMPYRLLGKEISGESGKIWFIEGTLPEVKRDGIILSSGGVPYLKVRQRDGAILGVFHDE
ncbi:NTF2 fold immunity protein [Entomospira culicis]|nr:NTF2 fold immunity protein [Entomospira culicis]WDI37395.1 NTF2 fold immunity protein [Entomospira culicis]